MLPEYCPLPNEIDFIYTLSVGTPVSLALEGVFFVVFGPSETGLGGLFGTLVAPWDALGFLERTFGYGWLSFATFGRSFGRLWGPWWRTLAAFGLRLGPLWGF